MCGFSFKCVENEKKMRLKNLNKFFYHNFVQIYLSNKVGGTKKIGKMKNKKLFVLSVCKSTSNECKVKKNEIKKCEYNFL